MANIFLVKRDLVTEPWTANHRFFTRIAKWLFIFILKCDCKPWFSFSCKKFSSECFKKQDSTTSGKETTRLNQNYVWTSADRAGRQGTLLIPPFLLVFLGIIAEWCLDGRKVLPQIIVLFSLYKVHANKKASVHKEKSKVLLSCKVHKKTCKHLRKMSWILVENSVWRNRRVSETPFFWEFFFGGGGRAQI